MRVRASRLAEVAGCNRQNISKEIKKQNLVRGDDGLIDLDNHRNKQWLLARGLTPVMFTSMVKAKKPKKRKSIAAPGREGNTNPDDDSRDPGPASVPDDFAALTGLPERLQNMTIRELVMKYGAPMNLKTYVEILAKIMEAQRKDVEIQARRLETIPKDFVTSHVFQYLEVLSSRLFDYPDSFIDAFIAEVQADPKKARIALPEKMRKELGKLIRESKQSIERNLKNLRSKHDNSDDSE
ncbi:MAG: hypothetical protein KA369_08220 [Spirochaetes bacterium]|nr:hypothetical protein [Spirochaetota bacterium]